MSLPEVIIYADGACKGNPGPGGFAAMLIFEDRDLVVMGGEVDTTNNKMELRAVIQGLKLLNQKCKVQLVIDSTYIRGMLRGNIPRKNQDLIRSLLKAVSDHVVEVTVIKGHSGNKDHDYVDMLASDQALRHTEFKQPELQL